MTRRRITMPRLPGSIPNTGRLRSQIAFITKIAGTTTKEGTKVRATKAFQNSKSVNATNTERGFREKNQTFSPQTEYKRLLVRLRQPAVNPNKLKGAFMLYTIAAVLLILWLLGLVSSYTMGGFIHILLVVAIVMILINLISGRRRLN